MIERATSATTEKRGGRKLAALFFILALPTTVSAMRVPLDFSRWQIEAEDPAARVTRNGNLIDVDTAKGLTLWFTRPMTAPATIRFEARAVSGQGANDKVSDLNAFWMATERDGTSPLIRKRTGRFEDYDTLLTYYVGIGGNRNTSTRMRRYIGRVGDRPLLPQHDRADHASLLIADRWTTITLSARGTAIEVHRDGQLLFTMADSEPYRRGWFGLRTTWSHLQFRNITIDPR